VGHILLVFRRVLDLNAEELDEGARVARASSLDTTVISWFVLKLSVVSVPAVVCAPEVVSAVPLSLLPAQPANVTASAVAMATAIIFFMQNRSFHFYSPNILSIYHTLIRRCKIRVKFCFSAYNSPFSEYTAPAYRAGIGFHARSIIPGVTRG
jgi:hypothetical protein